MVETNGQVERGSGRTGRGMRRREYGKGTEEGMETEEVVKTTKKVVTIRRGKEGKEHTPRDVETPRVRKDSGRT